MYVKGTEKTKHIYAGDQLIATIKGTGATAAVYPISTDHLTGSNVVTNSSGAIEELMDYYPYGDIRLDEKASTFSEQRKYAGHEYDADTGLSYMNARYYNGKIGRFVSQDPAFLAVTFDLTDPQSLNSYAYARNNPLRYIDPTGAVYTEALAGYAVGFGQGIYSGVAGLANAVIHPIQTVNNTIQLYGAGISAGRDLYSGLANNPSQTLGDIKTGFGLSYNEFASKSYYEQGKAVGNVFGQIEVAAAVAKVGSELNSQKISSPDVKTKIHGNSLNSPKLTTGYTLRKEGSDQIMKFGETTRPETRYSNKYLGTNNVYFNPETTGSKQEMHFWQHNQILQFKNSNQGQRPPLNKSDW